MDSAHGKLQSDLEPVTMEAILGRSSLRVSNVRWANRDTLVADFTSPGESGSRTRIIGLDGIPGAVLGEGELSALAPDGRALLQRSSQGWILREFGTASQSIVIEERKDNGSQRPFSTWVPPEWSPDGQYAAVVEQSRSGMRPATPETIEVDGVSIVDFDRKSASSAKWTTRISIVGRGVARAVREFTIPGIAMQVSWDADESLYVSQVRFDETDPSTRLLRFSLRDDEPRQVYRTPGRFQSMHPAVQPNGRLVALAIDADNRKWDDFVSLVLIDAKTGDEIRRLTRDLPITGTDYLWSADGSEIYARVRHGGLDEVWTIPLGGKPPRPLARGNRRHFDLALSADGRRLSYQTEDGFGRKDIRVLDLKSGEEEVIFIFDEPAKEFRLGQWRQIQWKSTDGVRPYGYLVTPPGFEPDRRYPMLVDVHGGGPGSRLYLMGPFTISAAKGPLEWHAWAAMGYVVFVPDYRSTGNYGPQVIAARYEQGELSQVDDMQDIVSGVRYVTDMGFIDPARIAILGHSAGGPVVYLSLVRHSDLFAAAVLNEPMEPDPASMFIDSTTGDSVGDYRAGVFSDLLGGTLAEVPDRYKKNYMFDAHLIKTPTLILLGAEKNGGVHHMPYEVIYSILKERRIPVRMLSFVDEGHTYSSPVAARIAFEEVQRWMQKHTTMGQE